MKLREVGIAKLINLRQACVDALLPDGVLQRNKLLFNKHTGERCFVLGSGNSINLYDISRLSSEHVITQNNFHQHESIKLVNPVAHCVVPFYQTEKEYPAWIEWLEEMRSRLPSETSFVFAKNTMHLVKKVFGDSKNVFYIRPKYRVLTLDKAKMDLTKSVMQVPTALTQCLVVAIYMGFKEIVLLGFDFDQIISSRQNDFNRFYGLSKITDTVAERKYEDEFAGERHEQVWLNRWLTIRQLMLVKRYAAVRDTRIVNGSEEGILNVFKRQPVGKEFERIALR